MLFVLLYPALIFSLDVTFSSNWAMLAKNKTIASCRRYSSLFFTFSTTTFYIYLFLCPLI